MRIGVLQADHVDPDLTGICGVYPDMFRALLEPVVPDLSIAKYDCVSGEFPDSADDCDAYLITGSRRSVYDDDEYISGMRSCVARLHGKVPIVGICFGHQLIADTLGGRVAKHGAWGVGVTTADILEREPWMKPPVKRFSLMAMHQDQVFDLPSGAVRLAGSRFCPNAMFRVGSSTLGMQGHPEFPAAYTRALIFRRAERIGEETKRTGLDSLSVRPHKRTAARWIWEFIKQAKSH